MKNPAAVIYWTLWDGSERVYHTIKTRRSTESFLKRWFAGLHYSCSDNDPAQVGSTWYRVVNRSGESKAFTNWQVYNDYSLLQVLVDFINK